MSLPTTLRRWLLTSRVIFIFALLWAVSTFLLVMQLSLPHPNNSGSLPSPPGVLVSTTVIEEQRRQREGARSLNAADDVILPTTASFVYPLHAHSGTHHAYLYIGSPPQRQTLIVDTGSRITAFPCQPHCPDCGIHASEQFYSNKSSTHEVVPCSSCLLSKSNTEEMLESEGLRGLRGSKELPNSCYNNHCEIEQSYTEGSSWRAFEVKDKVWLGTDDNMTSAKDHQSHATPFVFGCQVSEEGLFKKQYADGIMGLSMYTQTLFKTFNEQGVIPHESFSLCFNKAGGYLGLGGAAVKNHLSPMQFTPFAKKNTWYYTVNVKAIYVGSHMLPQIFMKFMNDYKGTIVDSGTTDTFLPQKIAKPFLKAWQSITGRSYSNSLQLYTYEQFTKLPSITFELDGGVNWEVEPFKYMEDAADNTRLSLEPWHGKRGFISRMYVTEPRGAVLGSNVLVDHDVYFDVANRRLGIAKASCILNFEL